MEHLERLVRNALGHPDVIDELSDAEVSNLLTLQGIDPEAAFRRFRARTATRIPLTGLLEGMTLILQGTRRLLEASPVAMAQAALRPAGAMRSAPLTASAPSSRSVSGSADDAPPGIPQDLALVVPTGVEMQEQGFTLILNWRGAFPPAPPQVTLTWGGETLSADTRWEWIWNPTAPEMPQFLSVTGLPPDYHCPASDEAPFCTLAWEPEQNHLRVD